MYLSVTLDINTTSRHGTIARIGVKFAPFVNGNCSKGIFARKSSFPRPRSLTETDQHPSSYLSYAIRKNLQSFQDCVLWEQVRNPIASTLRML